MNAEMPKSFSTTKNQRTKTQAIFYTKQFNKQTRISQIRRTSKYVWISKPEISVTVLQLKQAIQLDGNSFPSVPLNGFIQVRA
jgi:hypothetical protein